LTQTLPAPPPAAGEVEAGVIEWLAGIAVGVAVVVFAGVEAGIAPGVDAGIAAGVAFFVAVGSVGAVLVVLAPYQVFTPLCP